MQRQMGRGLLFAVMAYAAVQCLPAQNLKKITIRVLDGRTGEKISPNNIEVRINRERAPHVDFMKMNDDGTAEVTLPESATAISLRATYDNATEYYVNCDVARQKDTSVETWFPVADVLKDGLVMPNECWKSKDVQKNKFEAKPGEFLLLVRKRSIRDQIPYSIPY